MIVVTLMLWIWTSSASEWTIREDYQLGSAPLSTDVIIQRDPDWINPHLATWMLDRQVQLGGLRAVSKLPPATGFGVELSGLSVTTRGLVRGAGPWFFSLDEFPCSLTPLASQSWFATQDGAQHALTTAREEWMRTLRNESTSLQILLKRVNEETESKALEQAEKVFRSWLRTLQMQWREGLAAKTRRAEWQFYREETKCSKSQSIQSRSHQGTAHSVRARMEVVQPSAPPVDSNFKKLLARVPAQLWVRPSFPKERYWSVHLDTIFAGTSLTGKFLIDPGAPKSVVSPTWLETQGVHPALLVVKDRLPEHVRLSLPLQGSQSLIRPGGTLANTVRLDHVKLAGLDIPVHQFLLKDVDFFAPTPTTKACCDGVLGADFLKLYPIEFQQEIPAEVRVWPAEAFSSQASQWDEIHLGATGEVAQTLTDAAENERSVSWVAQRGLAHPRYTLDLPHGRVWWFPEKTRSMPQPSSNRLATETK